MGRADVRSAVTTTITNANIPYVGTVYPARPTIMAESDYVTTMSGQAVGTSPNGSACVLVVNLPGKDKRTRMALVGRGAVDDMNVIPVALELFFASTGGDALTAQQDYDTVVDALVVTIRNNPTMSAPASVWSAGEYQAGVTHDQDQPISSADGLTVVIAGVVRFECWEQLVGTNV